MTAYFFDTSALVKRYVVETGSDWVRAVAAVRQNELSRLRALLASHPELVKERYSDGGERNFSLLYLATKWHRSDCAAALVDAGADPDQPSGGKHDVTPLAKALSRGYTNLAARLVAIDE